MAVIGSIRKRGTLIVVVVGFSLLAFILTGSQSFFGGSSTTVGSFNGGKVNVQYYQQRVESKTEFVKIVNPQAELDERTLEGLRDEVWEDIIRERVYEKQYKMLGIVLSEQEINDLVVGESAHPTIKQQFVNQQTGQFDPGMAQRYLAQFEDPTGVPEDKMQQWLSQKAYWEYVQATIRIDRLQNKYVNLVTKGLYVTSKEAESQYKSTSDQANIRFLVKPYAAIPDSAINYTEEELVNFFKEHKYRMRSKKSKAIKYAVFLSIPTTEDSLAIHNKIVELRDQLAEEEDDTTFVLQSSDDPFPPTFFKQGMVSPELDSILFTAPKGTMAGPVIDNGFYIVAKKLEERFIPDSTKARHILIQPAANTPEAVDAAMLKRDSIYDVIKAGGDFVALAAQFGMDGTAQDSGNVGWFGRDAQMDRFFLDSCFAHRKGDLVKVNSQFGFHVVYVQDQTKLIKESQYAIITKLIKPSDETMKVQYALASDMAYGKGEGKDFDGAKYMEDFAKKHQLVYREEPSITPSTKNLMGMDETKSVITWALGAKTGEISDIFESGDHYIVAILTASRPDGIPALNDVRDEAVKAFKQHKKAEQFISEFNAATATGGNIAAIGNAMKLTVMSAEEVAFGSFFIPGAGVEPRLLGAIFGTKIGQLSKPIEGNGGVFMVVVDQFKPAPDLPDYKYFQMQMMQASGNRANDAFDALKDKANIKDYRYKFDLL